MSTMTHLATSFAETHHRLPATAALVTIFWLLAAAGVAGVQIGLAPLWSSGAAATSIVVIVLSAYGYTRCCARWAGMSHALGVGIAWLMLGIVTEIAMTARLGRAWYAVLGSPARPLLRNVLLFVWIFSPALFARGEDGAGDDSTWPRSDDETA